jgi:hypothetical protein
VEDHESLEAGTVVGQLSHAIKDKVDNLLPNGVVTTGVVIGGILLTGDELLGMRDLEGLHTTSSPTDCTRRGW